MIIFFRFECHLDLKPENILLKEGGGVAICDFGSCWEGCRVKVEDYRQCVEIEEFAEKNSTLQYRAPELCMVKEGSEISEKVDIFGLGGVVFGIMSHISPFTKVEMQGGSPKIAILGGKYEWEPKAVQFYSEEVRKLVDSMLTTDPSLRPSANQIIFSIHSLLQQRQTSL